MIALCGCSRLPSRLELAKSPNSPPNLRSLVVSLLMSRVMSKLNTTLQTRTRLNRLCALYCWGKQRHEMPSQWRPYKVSNKLSADGPNYALLSNLWIAADHMGPTTSRNPRDDDARECALQFLCRQMPGMIKRCGFQVSRRAPPAGASSPKRRRRRSTAPEEALPGLTRDTAVLPPALRDAMAAMQHVAPPLKRRAILQLLACSRHRSLACSKLSQNEPT